MSDTGSPIPTPSPPPPPPVPALPVAALSYSSNEYDRARDISSLDREMTARLCRTFGICLTLLGVAAMLLMCPMACQQRSPAGSALALLFPLFALLVPGVILMSCVEPIRAVRKSAAIVVLLVGLWLAALLGLMLLGMGVAALTPVNTTPAASLALQSAIVVLLLGGTIKLLYHDIRLLAAPGRGATRDVIVDVGEMLSGGPGGRPVDDTTYLRRLGVVRVITGSIVAVVAIALLWMSATRVPPPPSAQQTGTRALPAVPATGPGPAVPFDGDVYAREGLASADRALVAGHLARDVALSDERRRQLEDVLREVGGTVIDDASWRANRYPEHPTPPEGPATRPLTAQDVEHRLPELRSGRGGSPRERTSVTQREIRLSRGGWSFRWDDRWLWFSPDNSAGGQSRNGPSFVIRGDGVLRPGLPGQWSHGAVARFLQELQERGAVAHARQGTPRTITASQAQSIHASLFSDPPPVFSGGRDNPPVLPGSALIRADGIVELTLTSGPRWVDTDGAVYSSSPEARAPSAVIASQPKRLAGSPAAAGVLLLAAAGSIVMGARLARAATSSNAVRAGQILRGLMTASAVGLLAAAWFTVQVLRNEPGAHRWGFDPVFVISILLAATVAVWTGFRMPTLGLRRLAART